MNLFFYVPNSRRYTQQLLRRTLVHYHFLRQTFCSLLLSYKNVCKNEARKFYSTINITQLNLIDAIEIVSTSVRRNGSLIHAL